MILAAMLAVYFALASFYALVLVPHPYEAQYLALGPRALRGEISLYDDALTGQWMPLPFYVYGLTQLWGPSLLAARALAVLMGAGVLALTWNLARRLGGQRAAVIACVLFVSHGLVMGYYATAHFAPLVALCVLGALNVMEGEK